MLAFGLKSAFMSIPDGFLRWLMTVKNPVGLFSRRGVVGLHGRVGFLASSGVGGAFYKNGCNVLFASIVTLLVCFRCFSSKQLKSFALSLFVF